MSKNTKQFVMDILDIRRRARQHMEQGALTKTYGCDRDMVVGLLNAALATEVVCVLRYKRHYYMAQGIHSQSIRDEFREHAEEELQHVGWLAERIIELGGEPDFSPHGIADRAHSEYAEGTNLIDMIEEDLVAERIAIDSYRSMIQYIGDGDSSSRRVLERILEVEEEHAEDLVSLLRQRQSFKTDILPKTG
ncbi:MAG: bacterioferritin [Deltaproteobacteria bacterium]|nr:bacterioferritin [Deltaproteobacteria bacterium]